VHLARRAGADVRRRQSHRGHFRRARLTHGGSRSLAFADDQELPAAGYGSRAERWLRGHIAASPLRPNGRFRRSERRTSTRTASWSRRIAHNRSFHAIGLIPLFTEQPEFSGEMLQRSWRSSNRANCALFLSRCFRSVGRNAFRYGSGRRNRSEGLGDVRGAAGRVVAACPAASSFPGRNHPTTGGSGDSALVAEWMVERAPGT
jgi:hypothetical protein